MTRTYNTTSLRDRINRNDEKPLEIGEIKIELKKNVIFKPEKMYYVKYIYNFKNSVREKDYFYGVLKNTLLNSYIFNNVSKFSDMKNHDKCKLTVPVNWVDMIEIYTIFPKIPLDIILHEIMEYL